MLLAPVALGALHASCVSTLEQHWRVLVADGHDPEWRLNAREQGWAGAASTNAAREASQKARNTQLTAHPARGARWTHVQLLAQADQAMR